MEHKKDIGKAIREKLDALDKSPGDELWAAIEADLPKKKKRRILPFWLIFTSLIVIGLLVWTLFDSPGYDDVSPERMNQQVTKPENAGGVENGILQQNAAGGETPASRNRRTLTAGENDNRGTKGENPGETGVSNAASSRQPAAVEHHKNIHGKAKLPARNKRTDIAAAQQDKKNRNAKTRKPSKENRKTDVALAANGVTAGQPSGAEILAVIEGKSADSAATPGNLSSANEAAKAANDSIKQAAVEKRKKRDKPQDSLATREIEEASFKTFSVFLYAAPTAYNTFSKNSSIDTRLDSLPRRAEITFNFGGYLSFDYDDKWSFRFGVARTDFKLRTEGVSVSSLAGPDYNNVEYNDFSNSDLHERFADSGRFDLVQQASYLEFPIEIKYKLIDKKFGVEAIGGFSTSLLKDNSVTAESDHNGSIVIGSTKDMYKAYFSVNAGAGFYYRLAGNFRINIEPVFKYHFRTASTALQPYSIAVLGGLEYRFNWTAKNKKDQQNGGTAPK